MKTEIVVVGNELLNGDLADTNTARLGRLMRSHGLAVHRGQCVPDEEAAIVTALELASSRSDLVLVTGGLGPTEDDLTVASAAVWMGVPMREDAATLDALKQRFAARGYPFTPNNAKQALVPEGATVLPNPVGTAPAVRMEHSAATLFFFPGVPRELERLAADYLEPWLAANAPVRAYRSRVLKTFGATESQIATALEVLPRDDRLHVAFRAHFPEIQVSFHVLEPDGAAADALLDGVTRQARELLGSRVYSEDAGTSFAEALGARMLAAGATLALAESCTGGMAAAMCVDVPGSSRWLREGAVTYSNEAKSARLDVPPELIAAHGAVSEQVAIAMAEGMLARSGATHAVAITGVAGPGGGTPDKPVGTIHFALATADGTTHRKRRLPFDRQRNRLVSAWFALDMVRRELLDR